MNMTGSPERETVGGPWKEASPMWGVPEPGTGAWDQVGIDGRSGLARIMYPPGQKRRVSPRSGEYGRPKTMRVTLSDGTRRLR